MTNISHELFKEAKTQFADHLDIADNSRIIFSGKFGHGKTTFLKHYFNEAAQEKYNPIFLYPVNYSVSTNEDIFEYIKYDILVEMIRSERYEFKCDTSDFWDNVPFYIYKQPEKVISIILGMIPQLGKTAKGIFDELVELKKELKESFERYKEEQDDFVNIKEFLEGIELKPGSIHDNGITTNIIRNAISKAKESDKKENVLIIDDLDRIDPEHIFRILNVFAAHFDSIDTLPNKFGFDKIIVVCDIENIRNIFKAKYGISTDFNGYVDKFYSHKIFDYDIKEGMLNYAFESFSKLSIKTNNKRDHHRYEEMYRNKIMLQNDFFHTILKGLIDSGEIDMRNLVKWHGRHLNYKNIAVYITIPASYNEEYCKVLLSIQVLCDIKGSAGGLKSAIDSLHIFTPLRNDFRIHFIRLAYIYLFPEHQGKSTDTSHFPLTLNGQNLLLTLTSVDNGRAHSADIIKDGLQAKIYSMDFIELFKKVVNMIASKQIVFS